MARGAQEYQPASEAEHIVFYVICGINLLNVPLMLYALIYRAYLPIRCKQVAFSAGMGFGCMVLNIGLCLSLGMLGFDGPILSQCFAWISWVTLTLGIGVFFSLICMRMIIFYRIFVSRNQRTYKESTVKRIVFLYWPLLILWLPAFVTSVVGQTISSKNTAALTTTSDGIAVCKVVPAYLYFIFSYAMALVVVAWALYYRMRHIPEAFNEFRLSFWMLSIFTMLLTFNITMLALNYMALAWTRITLAVCNTLFLNAYMWQVLGPPIYGHIFHRQETLCRIIDLIHQESLSARHMNADRGYKELYGFDDADSITHGDDKSAHRGNSESKYIGSVMDIAYYPHIEGMSDSDFSITAGNKGPRQII